MIGHYQAVELQQLADYARLYEGDEFAYLEVATLLHITDRAAQRRMRFARTLTNSTGDVAALKEGWIEEFKATLIAEAVTPLSDEDALRSRATVLDEAPRQTPTQLRNTLAKVVIAVDPRAPRERRKEQAIEQAGGVRPTDAGQAMSPSTTVLSRSPPCTR